MDSLNYYTTDVYLYRPPHGEFFNAIKLSKVTLQKITKAHTSTIETLF